MVDGYLIRFYCHRTLDWLQFVLTHKLLQSLCFVITGQNEFLGMIADLKEHSIRSDGK